jgi:DnaJ-domain-containing protein 1
LSQKRRFTAQPKTIQRDLRRVITAMGATSLKVSQDIFEGTAEIVFDRGSQRYVFRCEKYDDALDNLRAAQLATPTPVAAGAGVTYLWRALEDALRGVTSEAQTLDRVFAQFFLGFAATPDDTVLLLGSGEEKWWKILDVVPEADQSAIRNAFRALARRYHPDAGGDPKEFQRLRRAYEQALTQLDRTGA